jgi:hypothetical protein
MHTPPESSTAFANCGDVSSSILKGMTVVVVCCESKTDAGNINIRMIISFFMIVLIIVNKDSILSGQDGMV